MNVTDVVNKFPRLKSDQGLKDCLEKIGEHELQLYGLKVIFQTMMKEIQKSCPHEKFTEIRGPRIGGCQGCYHHQLIAQECIACGHRKTNTGCEACGSTKKPREWMDYECGDRTTHEQCVNCGHHTLST